MALHASCAFAGDGITNGTFSSGLSGWTVSESGGGSSPGSVSVEAGRAVIREGDSFLVSLHQTFAMPSGARSLLFDLFPSPGFDRSDTFIPDAFEVSLLNGMSVSPVPTWQALATSFFNVQEDGTVNLGSTTTWDGLTAAVDVSAIAAGAELTLFFDFIGADLDTLGAFSIDNVRIDTDGPPPIPLPPAAGLGALGLCVGLAARPRRRLPRGVGTGGA